LKIIKLIQDEVDKAQGAKNNLDPVKEEEFEHDVPELKVPAK
jgi:hypothetical protein